MLHKPTYSGGNGVKTTVLKNVNDQDAEKIAKKLEELGYKPEDIQTGTLFRPPTRGTTPVAFHWSEKSGTWTIVGPIPS